MSHSIRPIHANDAAEICAIYNPHVLHTQVTFEEYAVSCDEMASRIQRICSEYPYLVYEEEGQLLAYAYADQWRTRSAYRKTAETTIYVCDDAHGRGIGYTLYSALLQEMRQLDFHIAIGVITLPNEASEALHKKFNFHPAGVFHEVGRKNSQWLDVAFWELNLTQ
ncbi:MAG: N-acetyltransferase family protein [Planctomycetes bacterium]|nr:N-acetyltransferase family protein [Planctomycetota bacterium]